MIFLFDIIFQSGEFIGSDDSAIADFLINVTGALIGTGTALYVFQLTKKDERRKQAANDTKIVNQKLSYFSSMVSSIINYADEQIGYFNEFVTEFEQNTLKIPKLKKTPLGELKRFAEIQNHEDYYFAYLDKFGYDKETVKEYRTFFTTIDFLYAAIISQEVKLQKSREFDYARNVDYKKIVEKSMDDAVVYFNNSRNTGSVNDYAEFLNNSINSFYEVEERDDTDIRYFQNAFVNPVKIGSVKRFKHVQEATEMAKALKQATYKFTEINNSNTDLMVEFKAFVVDFKKSSERLSTSFKKLDKEFTIK